MSVIAPTVTCENDADYKATIERLYPFAKRVHIDISDGVFAPTFLVKPDKIWWPQEWEVDIHAMVAEPSKYVDSLIELHPATVIFHAEAEEDILPSIQKLKVAGIRAGVALLKPTVPSTVDSYIRAVDHVLIFSGDLGYHGGKADLMQLEKVRLIHAMRDDLEIGWDGGAGLDNVFSLTQGGVGVINVGGAINKADNPADVYDKLVSEINKRSVI